MKNLTKALAIIHLLVLAIVIYWNYYSNTGAINGVNVGDVSAKYDSLFTPAPYTFAIWGIIYLGLIYHGVYMLYCAFYKKADDSFITKSAPWITLAHLLNGVWLWFWLQEEIGICAFLILGIFVSLMIAVLKLRMEKWNAPISYMAGVWWPIDLYVGWLAVALIANISSYLNAIGWELGFSDIGWTIFMLAVATAVNLFMIVNRNMREFALVGIWALVGIASRHWGQIQEIQYAALSGAIILFIAINIHAYYNRATLPFIHKKSKT